MSHRHRPIGALLLVLSVTLGLGLAEEPAFATDYPTWEDVQAAKQNEKAKKAEIAKLEQLIAGFETEAADTAKVALIAAEDYNQALERSEQAARSADALQKTADAAAKRATTSRS